MMDYYIGYFLTCFTTFFVIIDPPGNLPIFIALTERFSDELRERISKRATLIAASILILTMVTGGGILDFFGVSINSLRVAGGILLFIASIDILLGGTRKETYRRRAEESIDVDSIAVFPLALPLYTGPGAITAGIVVYSQATDLFMKAIAIVSAVIVYAIVRVSHIYSTPIIRLLGRSGADIIARILAVFLAAIAIEFVFDGLYGWLSETGLI
ncbi:MULTISPECIES: NAAT family transporter [unclassified Archaeoglobus]|jgi:multiple antibiotic resistance protein|uniref:NAAT family transporter n=1 Tax=unclassified Archaeoglobus TaxID=2643606 RepID=UPI0025BDA5AF|nr:MULTISPECIES: NAAT family transporter [unclassified Archaeoglobus]